MNCVAILAITGLMVLILEPNSAVFINKSLHLISKYKKLETNFKFYKFIKHSFKTRDFFFSAWQVKSDIIQYPTKNQ